MSDESSNIPNLISSASPSDMGGVSIGCLYGEVSLRHDRLDRDASAAKATVAGVAQQLGDLGAVQVASGLTAQFQQVAAAIAPVAAMASGLASLLNGLTQSAGAGGAGASQAQVVLARVQAAAARMPGSLRLPGGVRGGRGGSAGLTAAQKNALAVEEAHSGGDPAGRLQLERNRIVAGMRNRGASPAQIASAAAGYDTRIAADRAVSASRREENLTRSGANAERRSLSGEARAAGLDAALQNRIAAAARRGGDPGVIQSESVRKALADNAAMTARISQAAASAPEGESNPAIVQARALAGSALSAGQSAAKSNFVRATDAQGLQTLGASLDMLKAKRDAFLAGWKDDGEDARRFLADLASLYRQVSAASTATPGQQEAQAHLLEEIGGSARAAAEQVRALPNALRDLQDAVGGAFGDALDRSLLESQAGAGNRYESRQRRKRPSFGTSMRRGLESDLLQSADAGLGRVAQRGVSGLLGSAFRGVSGLFSPGGLGGKGKADGSAASPFYTRPASVAAGAKVAAGVSPVTAASSLLDGATPWGTTMSALSHLSSFKTGGLFGELGKLLHFAIGGPVPDVGHGGGDTVPAMLSPGEFVLSKPMLAQMASARSYGPEVSGLSGANRNLGTGADVSVVIHQHGDNHFHTDADLDEFSRRQAWSVKNQLQTSAPGLF